MSYLMLRGEVSDFDNWKRDFDADPVGRIQAAKGHRLYRGVENLNEVIIQLEFASAQQATSFREQLLNSRVLERLGPKLPAPPIVVEEADAVSY